MKNYLLKSVSLIALGLFLFTSTAMANVPVEKQTDKVSKVAPSQTISMQTFKQNVLKEQIKSLTFKEKVKLFRTIRKEKKKAERSGLSSVPTPVLYILAIFIPPVAVGIFTDWKEPTLWNLLWTLLFWLPGIIHAFYIILG